MTERSLYMKVENKFLKVREWIKTELQKSAIGRVIFRHYQERDIWAFSEFPDIFKSILILFGISAICYGLSYLVMNIATTSIGLILVSIFVIGMVVSGYLAVIICLCAPLFLIDDFIAGILFM